MFFRKNLHNGCNRAIAVLIAAFLLVPLRLADAQTPIPAPATLPPGQLLLPLDATRAFGLSGVSVKDAQLEIVPVTQRDGLPANATGEAYARAARVTTARVPRQTHDIQLQAPLESAFKLGDAVMIELYARGELLPDPTRATGSNLARIEALFEEGRPPWTAVTRGAFLNPDRWTRLQLIGAAPADLPARGANLNIRVGFALQTIEITGVRATTFGQSLTATQLKALVAPPKVRKPAPKTGRNLPFWAPANTVFPRREQVSLNGTWKFTPMPDGKIGAANEIPVPEYWDARPDFDTDQAIYERRVAVPQNWTSSRFWVEFEGVAHSAEVFINNEKAGQHVGGWVPFRVDATRWARHGESFDLKVIVRGGSLPPVTDAAGRASYPLGWYGNESRWGICFPVWLRGYGVVSIEDAFIQTSVQNKRLTVDYTLHNADSRTRTVQIEARVGGLLIANLGGGERDFSSRAVTLAPGETRVVRADTNYPDAPLWWPDAPVMRSLRSRLRELGASNRVVDEETRRFGFREFTIQGNQFTLNGVRTNLLGDSTNTHAQGYKEGRYRRMWPGEWASTVDRLKSANIRILRFHQSPAPDWMLDVCDEKGLLVVAESGIYARDYVLENDKERYLQNSRDWMKPWVRGSRNHPSVVMWSAENEMGVGWLKYLTNPQIASLGAAIRAHDTSRPVIYDGDRDISDADTTVNFHYPEGYENEPKGSIYSWANRVHASKPTGTGEFLTSYGKNEKRNLWWQGTWVRGLRYTNWTDVRPYTLGRLWDEKDAPDEANVRRSFAPVALFDKDYDDLGIDPLLDESKLPVLDEGATAKRILVLYNDEFWGEDVSVEVSLQVGGTEHGRARRNYKLALGEHRDIPLTFQVPALGGQTLEMTLATFKNGVKKFEEIKRFKIAETGFEGTASQQIGLAP